MDHPCIFDVGACYHASSCAIYAQPKAVEYQVGVRMVWIKGFEPTTFLLQVESTNH